MDAGWVWMHEHGVGVGVELMWNRVCAERPHFNLYTPLIHL